jgi:hypothetical protein
MSNPDSTRPVAITAEEHAHPALRKLASACIAMARQLRQSASSSTAAEEGPRHD